MRLRWAFFMLLIVLSLLGHTSSMLNNTDLLKLSVKQYCDGKLEVDFCSKANLAIMGLVIQQREKVLQEVKKIKEDREKINKLIEKQKSLNFLKDFFASRYF